MRLFERAIRPPPPDDIEPNANVPAAVPPSTVGPDQLVTPGDPDGLEIQITPRDYSPPPTILASQWSGWPSEWWAPDWQRVTALSGIAWACVDFNARNLATMPPYLVNAAPTLDAEWLRNPDPELYSSWENFAKQVFWDYYAAGEAFVLATARYSTGWPARFHVLPGWTVNVEMAGGRRVYTVGGVNITADVCHIRYQDSVDDAHGHGPLEAGRSILNAAATLGDYANTIAGQGLVPSSILEAPEQMSPDQAEVLRDDWVTQRAANPGYPAVLSGGLKWTPTQLNPKDMALLELAQFTNSQIAVLLGVPPALVGLPTAGESLTYNTVLMALDQHWRTGLRPAAQTVMAGLSEWLLPRQTTVEVNKDAYVQPGPYERAQTYEILNRIRDDTTGEPVLSVNQIQAAERFRDAAPIEGVLGVSPVRINRIVESVPSNQDIVAILDAVSRVEWRNLQLLNGFKSSPAPYAPARYRLTLNNVVYCQGRIERNPGLTNADIGTVIAKVANDALPGGDLVFAVPTGQIQNFARLIVTPAGDIVFGGLLVAANPAAKEINLSQIVYSIEGVESFAAVALNTLKEEGSL